MKLVLQPIDVNHGQLEKQTLLNVAVFNCTTP